jgi:protein transport protein SEC24
MYFSRFDAARHGEKLYYELFRSIQRNTGTDVKIKVRCSKGFTVTEYFGSFGLRESVDFELSAIDADKSFGFQLRNDEAIPEAKTIYVQIAMLYSNLYGERRIRLFNVAYPAVKSLNQYFKSTVVESYAQYFLRQKLARLHEKGPKNIREEIINKLVDLLVNYRT